jgi:hypothetical protein
MLYTRKVSKERSLTTKRMQLFHQHGSFSKCAKQIKYLQHEEHLEPSLNETIANTPYSFNKNNTSRSDRNHTFLSCSCFFPLPKLPHPSIPPSSKF